MKGINKVKALGPQKAKILFAVIAPDMQNMKIQVPIAKAPGENRVINFLKPGVTKYNPSITNKKYRW